MNRDKREPEYPTELESQFILRLPEEPAKVLREALRTSENLKNRLSIQTDNDMRNGEVRFDHWLMHTKIVDLPTIIESLKTIDSKSFYKTADICQMMICKEEPDQTPAEEEPVKNKKKDPYKVDKKFLWPHGITPPTKNVRKRRFRKTLKKKCVESPEIEKEVKRLLRADNEAIKVTWEVINEEDDHQSKQDAKTPSRKDKKLKVAGKRGPAHSKKKPDKSNVVDIFGGAVSDSDNEEPNVNVDVEDSRLSSYDSRLSLNSSMLSTGESSSKRDEYPIQFEPQMFGESSRKPKSPTCTVTSATRTNLSSEEDEQSRDSSKDNMSLRIEQVRQQLEELKQRRQRTQAEIAGMENLALKQRFKDILHTLNQDIMYKEMEYQGLITLQNSEDI